MRLPNLEGQVLIFIFPKNRVAQLYHQSLGFPFHCLLRLTGLRWRYSNPPPHGYNPYKVKVTLWPMASQSACLGVKPTLGCPLWWEDGSAYSSAITQCSESHRTRNHTLLSHVGLSQPGGPGSHIYILKEHSGRVTPMGNGFPLYCLLRLTRRARVEVSNPPPYENKQLTRDWVHDM
jgi:hypothetical protein